MREIKFRAWDKKQKEIHTWESLKCNSISVAYLFNNTDLNLMQYTGLKDKKGIEIYNKDIIRDGGRLWIVEISNLYGVVLRLLKDKKITRPYEKFEKHLIDDFEVIGNIYEHTELLEGPK